MSRLSKKAALLITSCPRGTTNPFHSRLIPPCLSLSIKLKTARTNRGRDFRNIQHLSRAEDVLALSYLSFKCPESKLRQGLMVGNCLVSNLSFDIHCGKDKFLVSISRHHE